MSLDKPKICYVIPEYQKNTATHFAYLLDFVTHIAETFDVFLIVEKSDARIPTTLRTYQQKFSWFPLRWIENSIILKYARLCGYRDFYVHYSFLSAFNASLVTRIWGGRVFYWNCGLPWQYPRGFVRDFFERMVYRLVTYVVTGTETLKIEYAKHYAITPEKIKVMPNWIDTHTWQVFSDEWREKKQQLKQKLSIPENTKILLFVHRLSKRKGAHYIPEILNQLHDENVLLLVVGDGPERNSLKLATNHLSLDTKICFLGRVPQNEIVQYFSIADIFIMPSEEEGFPHVLLESMVCGVPFVAFDVGGVREITPPETHKFLYTIGDIMGFVGGIRSLLYSDILGAHTRSLEQNWVVRYDSDNVVKQFYELFKK